MSYDLVVFAADAAPKNRTSFAEWYKAQLASSDIGDDPAISTPELRAWFTEMIQSYPPMNGPLAPRDLPKDEAILTDYSVGKFVIYAAFAWSKAQQAYETTFELAAKHSVGILNVSSKSGEVWLPDGKGHLTLTHSG